MKNYLFVILVGVFLVAFAAAGCAAKETPIPPTPTPEVHPGEALLQTKCSTCHPVGTALMMKYNADGWALVIDKMVDRGMQITDEQKTQLVDYLAINYGK